MAAIVLSTAVILLASIDIGFLFYQKRDLQKVADMAAIAGAQQLAKDDCASAQAIAISNAQQNDFPLTPDVTIGEWNSGISNAEHFEPRACNTSPAPNAVRVTVSRNFGSFFGAWASQSVHASAIATGLPAEDTAVFSVGSRLLRIEDGVVPTLLSAIGLNINQTSIASYEGLSNVKVSTQGLLQALGFNIPLTAEVGTPDVLLETSTNGECAQNSCSLRAILEALSGVAGNQENLINLLGLTVDQLNTQVKLLSDENGRGLLALLETANGSSALTANISVGDLISTALQIASSERAVDLPGLNVNLSPLATVTTKLGIVEAASIGIGGVDTKAYTSQVRLYTKIDANAALVTASLPVAIDLINGEGTITELCENGDETATIKVSAPVLKTCVGKFNETSVFSRATSCDAGLENHRVLSILGTLQVDTSFALDALPNEHSVTLRKGETVITGRNDLALGTTLTNLYKAVLAEILGKLLQEENPVTRQNLVSNLIGSTNNTVGAATQIVSNSLTNLRDFINSFQNISNESVGSAVLGLLNSLTNLIGNLLGGVLDLVSNLLGDLGCALAGIGGQAAYNECKLNQEQIELEKQLNSASKVLITLLGLVVNLLEPILNQLGNLLAQLLDDLLGLQLGQVDVTLIDLQCGGKSNVRLVH